MQQICTHHYKLCNMNKIGFENFRRFTKLDPIEYKGITFLVGRNNSGKSTLVKSLLLVNDYFKSRQLKTFAFGSSILEDANIVTYGRAKNRLSNENAILFDLELSSHAMRIIVTGEDDKTQADVMAVSIDDHENGLQFIFTPQTKQVHINRIRVPLPQENKESIDAYMSLSKEIDSLKSSLSFAGLKKSSREYLQLVDELNALEKKLELIGQHPSTIIPESDEGAKGFYSYTTSYNDELWFDEIIQLLLEEVHHVHNYQYNRIQQGEEGSKEFESLRGIYEDSQIINKSFQTFVLNIKNSSIIYLGANPAKQSALFPIRDKNNALAQAIHDFYQLKIESGNEAYTFVLRWMREFEIGESFQIKLHAGEAYEVLITTGSEKIPLADKGMGSIQAMQLILRLACIFHRGKNIWNVVVIEEPEINLHPALQSKLADLFLDVYTRDIRLMIETHSEYIIRKSQVLVVENELANGINDNPFCVYYFPTENEQPYELEFLPNGRFNRNFGEGFFDEATNKTMTLLKLEKLGK